MRLTILHKTNYQYEHPPRHLVQLLRLTPCDDEHQRVLEWRIKTPGKLTPFTDAFGNVSHTHVVEAPGSELKITVEGVVSLKPLVNGVLGRDDAEYVVPHIAYLVPTDLTAGFEAIDILAKTTLPNGVRTGDDVLLLAKAVCEKIVYKNEMTSVTSTAQQAFDLACGVCQDHAHVMIAACRSLGVSARYVSGYVDPGHSHEAASHAWVDVWVDKHWVSVDVTNCIFASDSHCRLSVGRDYLDACPIRGVRDGGGASEKLEASVSVQVD